MADIFRETKTKFPKNVYFVIFVYIKNPMIYAIAINVLNLRPFAFFVVDDPSPRFHQQCKPTNFLRTYV